MSKPSSPRAAGWALAAASLLALPAIVPATELKLLLPLNRTAYQTNEWIDLSFARQGKQDLAAGDLVVRVDGADGSRLSFTFAVPVVPAVRGDARRTEHLHLDGRLLRPGHYAIEVAADGTTAKTDLDIFTHLRRSSFRLVAWGGRAAGKQQLVEGEDSLGFNLFQGNPGGDDAPNLIRAGIDFMSNCTMSGGHQMDLRMECDWSDPYVTRGGTRRVVRRAFMDRTKPNVIGVHFYDEPGLTWHKDPKTGENTPHGIPSQVRAFESAFGKPPISYHDVKPDNPEDPARWRHWALWKLGFMDAAWKEASFGVSRVRPDYLSVTQSQYGWTAFTDGYYFNVVRSLPVISGHGGYDHYGLGYFNPSWTLEMARARDLRKPCWYLPTWYGNTPSDRFRMEQYLSFMTNIQGLMTPPDLDPFDPASKPAADGVVESNKLMARLGTIFTQMPVTRPPVAMLYSMSNNIAVQTRDMQMNYAHANRQGEHLPFTYLAGKMLHRQFLGVVEEDVLDGTLAANHKAVILTSLDYLDPKVVASLEDFAAHGGLVLMTKDCKVKVKGAEDLGAVGEPPDAEVVRKLNMEGKYQDAAKYQTVGKLFEGAAPLAKALETRLEKAGIKAIFDCDQPGVVATRQAEGDIEYLFAVNATYNPVAGGTNAIRATEANIDLPDDDRPVYDAVVGGPVKQLQKSGDKLAGKFRFGPGEMRVFARTARPIGKVQALPPVIRRDYTHATEPLGVEVGAALLDTQGRVLSAAAPLELRVIDPLGATRYEVFRATKDGTLRLVLPLAANDPAGEWKVTVRELLNNTEDMATVHYQPAAACGAMAGATSRAVSFSDDRDRIFRFVRVHHDITLVVGSSADDEPAAERIARSLRPWGVRCRVVKAADVNHPRPVTAEAAPTLVGLDPGVAKPGKDNPLTLAGFDVDGPVILLGTPQDNPLIAFVQQQRFLPYQPDPVLFPGRGRGYLAWQRDAIGAGQESITVISYHAEGMGEAAGSLSEAASGLEPLTRFELPRANRVAPATTSHTPPEAEIAWTATLPDRAAALKVADGRLTVLSLDGTLAQIDGGGKVIKKETVRPEDVQKTARDLQVPADTNAVKAAQKDAPSDRIVKAVAANGGRTAVAYWGGTVEVRGGDGKVQTSQLLPQDVTGLAWLDRKLVVGLANGQVVALAVK
jgi:hypothetical protein